MSKQSILLFKLLLFKHGGASTETGNKQKGLRLRFRICVFLDTETGGKSLNREDPVSARFNVAIRASGHCRLDPQSKIKDHFPPYAYEAASNVRRPLALVGLLAQGAGGRRFN